MFDLSEFFGFSIYPGFFLHLLEKGPSDNIYLCFCDRVEKLHPYGWKLSYHDGFNCSCWLFNIVLCSLLTLIQKPVLFQLTHIYISVALYIYSDRVGFVRNPSNEAVIFSHIFGLNEHFLLLKAFPFEESIYFHLVYM